VSVAAHQRIELRLGNSREHCRVRDLVAVQMQNREDGAVAARIQELVCVPARRQRSRLGFAVADDAGDEEIRIVEGRAVRVRKGVAELASLVNRAERLWRNMAGNASWKRELPEEDAQPGFVASDVRVDLAVRSLEVGVRDEPGA